MKYLKAFGLACLAGVAGSILIALIVPTPGATVLSFLWGMVCGVHFIGKADNDSGR